MKPDYGSSVFIPRVGATAVGSRKLLVAYNIHLNTKNRDKARLIVSKIRYLRDKNLITKHNGDIVDLEYLKCIEWYVEEYGFMQVSINVLDADRLNLGLLFSFIKKIAS